MKHEDRALSTRCSSPCEPKSGAARAREADRVTAPRGRFRSLCTLGSFSGLEQEAKKKNNNKTPDTNRTVYPQHTLTFLERQRETSLCASPVRLSTRVFINPRLCHSSHLSHRGKEGLTARTDIPRDVADVLGRSIKENPDHGCVRSVFAWINSRDNSEKKSKNKRQALV
ncbi:hypothetical protein KOW79_005588 [Hemibagrus wyckioides]|uniref:Uncharacterized protein n=1 Tax=Hemibagrus wyckioides TaxID=337641 RepID=A0A9D3P0P3_9TELE|nr:hypothetical protein KOW79_005588 [Hemibagrus wyckioides]